MHKTIILASLTLLTAFLVPVPGQAGGGVLHVVAVLDNEFVDAGTGTPVTQAALGDTIRWEFDGEIVHTASHGVDNTLDPNLPSPLAGDFESDNKQPGQVFEWDANDAGVYVYLCRVHPEMRGVVVVSA